MTMHLSRTRRALGAAVLIALGALPEVAAAQFGKFLKQKGTDAAAKAATDAVVKVAAPDSHTSATPPAAAPGGTPPASSSAAAAAPAQPGEGAWLNFDFQPGSRPIYVDDFSRDNVGDFPRRLEFVEGNMEVAQWNGARYLRISSSGHSRFALVLTEPLPERFTLEFDATAPLDPYSTVISFAEGQVSNVTFREYLRKGNGGVGGSGSASLGTTSSPLGPTGNEVFRFRIMADGKYVKVYMNETRLANVPNAELGRSNRIVFDVAGSTEDPQFIGNISLMAGGRRLYDDLAEKGRVATQGIYFDTGSDRIRPESTPTLKEIAGMLQEHPELALLIEGHTDNVGSAQANLALSDKRAAAVRQALVDRFGIAGTRLSTKGLGASKPSAPNTTPEGRQANRRVELVKS
jgi:OmpA-OmpF porin, OOP family